MKITPNTYLYKALLLVLVLVFCQVDTQAQGIGTVSIGSRIGNKVRAKTMGQIRKKKNELQSGVRQQIRDAKKGRHSFPRRGEGDAEYEEDASLDALIADPEVKRSIEDRGNDKRFVELFGEWWALPNEAELDLQKHIDSLKDLHNTVDSSLYRYPKMATEYQPAMVWGWHKASDGQNLYKSYNYSIINAISYVGYELDPLTGMPFNRPDLEPFINGDFVQTAKADSTRSVAVMLNLSCHIQQNVMDFLDNSYAQQSVIDTLIDYLARSGGDGIEIDFEMVPGIYKDDFFKFVKLLSATLTKTDPNYFIAMSIPTYDPQGIYDLQKFRDFVDFFLIRTDFHIQPDDQDPDQIMYVESPVAPLNFNDRSPDYDMRKVIEFYIQQIGILNSNRLILSIPYYGSLWMEENEELYILEPEIKYSDVLFEYVGKSQGGLDIEGGKDKTIMKWMFYDSLNNRTLKLFYDDVETLRPKIRLWEDYELGGIAVRYLGYDDGFDQLWQLLGEEMTEVIIPEDERLRKLREAGRKSRGYGTIMFAVLLYMTIFVALGFLLAMTKNDVRQRLFASGRFRFYYLGFFTVLILVLGWYMGLFQGQTANLMTGCLIGAGISWLILRTLAKQHTEQP